MQCVSHSDPFHFSVAIPNFLGTPSINSTRLMTGPLDLSNATSNILTASPPTSAAGHLHGKKNRNIHTALFNTDGRAQHGLADQFRPTSPTRTDCYLLKRSFQFVRHSYFVYHHDGIV